MSLSFERLCGAIVVTAVLTACSSGGDRPVQSADVAGRHVALSTASGTLSNGQNEVTLRITDSAGQPVEVTSPAVRFSMPAMGSMAAMASEAALSPAGQPGVYRGSVNLDMKGTWQTGISFQDAAGPHQVTFSVQAQ